MPCCFGAGGCSCYASVSSSSRLVSLISSLKSSIRFSEVTLGTFSVRFWGLFVLPCLAVLVPGGAFLLQQQQPSSISHQFPQVFSSSRVSEVTLGCSRYIHINTHTQHDTHIWEMFIVLFPLSPFFRGRRQGRQPLNILNYYKIFIFKYFK